MINHYLSKVIEGDVSAYSYIVNQYKNMAFSIALRVVNNREDAEEVTQDAFLKAYNSLKKFNHKSKFSTWLYTIVYNTAISKIRKNKKKSAIIQLNDEDIENINIEDIDNILVKFDEEDKKKVVNLAINKLSETEKLIITLYYLSEKSINKIIEITNFSNSNIKVILYRSRKKMYDELKFKSDKLGMNETKKTIIK
ncbi:MAG: sigma-70 family RNA polymerase sigma factor [Bacteroidetes bacterium]|nr:sigma-70 family RNA polymerase sigma factor [Bacteroidota bacterium]